LNRRGPRSIVCCWVTATTLTGMASNCTTVRIVRRILGTGTTYTKALKEIFCLGINLENTTLRLLVVESRNFWDVLIFALSLLFLKLEGDTTDWTTLNTLHQVGGVTSNLTLLDLFSASKSDCRTLLRRRLEAMIAISSQILLFVSKSRVNLG